MGLRPLLVIIALILVSESTAADTAPPARIFSQVGMSRDIDGKVLPPVVLDPESRDDLVELTYDLGRERTLVVRTNLASHRHEELATLAGVVRRGHDFVEDETGRQVRGDMLLYILSFAAVPRAYSFRTELTDPDRWSQVRLALMADRDALTGPGASFHVESLIYGTLPHELGHGLLAEPLTILVDIDGRPSHHTRWFTEGVCETLAWRFARRECPAHAWRLLRDRRVGRALESPAVRNRLFRWAQADRLGWELESDLYGGAMLLVMEWLETTPLTELLADLAAADSPADGPALVARLCRDTGATAYEMLDRAARAGHRLASPAYSRR